MKPTNGRREGGSSSRRSRRIYNLSHRRKVFAASRIGTRKTMPSPGFSFFKTFDRYSNDDFHRSASRQRRRLPASQGRARFNAFRVEPGKISRSFRFESF